GDFVLASDIAANKLVFTPAANKNGSPEASFTFQVQDDGGTANTGVDLDQSANTMAINVTSVNDVPAGANALRTILEDQAYTFSAADFALTDTNDNPANTLAAVIMALPLGGVLKLGGAIVAAGQDIAVGDLGKLVFTPAGDLNGAGSFTFQ